MGIAIYEDDSGGTSDTTINKRRQDVTPDGTRLGVGRGRLTSLQHRGQGRPRL